MIQVIDYKAGNLTSVVKALHHLGANVDITQDPSAVLAADKIVLPGVGHFQSTQLLTDLGLTAAVREAIKRGTPFLGICVGLQWLYEGSTEAPDTPGLGHFPGQCERFPATIPNTQPALHDSHASDHTLTTEIALKSPHVGWNGLDKIHPNSRLMRGVAEGSFVYFTHSWRALESTDTAATTHYGGPFTAAAERENVMGVQFHPEKSSETGLLILRNFLEL